MRDKELRLALICYGGVSLAIYMHGITKEIWHLIRASTQYHRRMGDPVDAAAASNAYAPLFDHIEAQSGVRIQVMVDIIAGASAGGINGIFLGQAIASGQSLEPLTELWLNEADIENLLDPDARPWSRVAKWWAIPLAWLTLRRQRGMIDKTVDPSNRAEVKRKLSHFVRARWFAPPFGGPNFTRILLRSLDAMAAKVICPRLLPQGHPLDLFVTVTDFHGHPERIKINSPAEVSEMEHRMTLDFTDHQASGRAGLGSTVSLAFAGRATASFPGAFPPFTVSEMDHVLSQDGRDWDDRTAFLQRTMPQGNGDTVMIDGSVLANAPFQPVLQALRNRPARRDIDRHFVYIDPKPGLRSIGGRAAINKSTPGFFSTLFGALSDIPRGQPIRDNLEAIENRSNSIRRLHHILDTIRPEIEATIAEHFGHTLFLKKPTVEQLHRWRAKAQYQAAKQAGYAYPPYGHLKISQVTEEIIATICGILGEDHPETQSTIRQAIWAAIEQRGVDTSRALSSQGASPATIEFLRDHDLAFRIRRLRMLNNKAAALYADTPQGPVRDAIQQLRNGIFEALSIYLDRQNLQFYPASLRVSLAHVIEKPDNAIEALAASRDLKNADQRSEHILADSLLSLPRALRREILLTYLGFPFYDIATLPILQDGSMDEFDEIKVDRISPVDAQSLRQGGPEATLKGIQLNSFGAFFSRSYRENDYLWGRLHGAERLIDIVLSAGNHASPTAPAIARHFKKSAFLRILDEERTRLTTITPLIDALEAQLAAWE